MPFSTLKTLENLTVFWYFQGVEKGCIGLIYFSIYVTARKCKGFSCSTGRIFNFLSKQHAASVKLQQKRKQINPVDTGRKLNVHKTFRRRPGRLLNVLCTFNLRPVSTGNLRVLWAKKKRLLKIPLRSLSIMIANIC